MKRPNIVFLFSDQQRWDTVSCYGEPLGSSFHLTPNLDQLAAEGVRFDSAMTCQPVCGPARACLQTGKYPSEMGCQINDMALPKEEKTIAKYLNEVGYETAYVGKWHLASHQSSKVGIVEGAVNYKETAVPEELRGGYKDYWMASDVLEFTSHGYDGYVFNAKNEKIEFTGYRADAMTDYALDYLRTYAQKDSDYKKETPFLLFVSYIEPHHQNDHYCFEGPDGSKEQFADFIVPKDLEGLSGDWESQMPDYLGCCKNLDDNVGRIVEELKRQGIYEDTVIFYTSDHGSHFRTRNGEYKRSCHDASIHVPLIIRGAQFLGGKVVERLTSLIDYAPTILKCAGIDTPSDMSGVPIQQLLEGDEPTHEDVFIQISESCVGRAIRTPQYTYCVQRPYGMEERALAERLMWSQDWEHSTYALASSPVYRGMYLYDLEKDPYQKVNLINEKEYSTIREILKEKLLYYIEKEEGEYPIIFSC